MSRTTPVSKLYVLGAGGFGREVAWLVSGLKEVVCVQFVVDRPEYLVSEVAGIPVRLLSEIPHEPDTRYVVAIGDPHVRKRLASMMERAGFAARSLIHPSVLMSNSVKVGPGAILAPGSILTVDIEVGQHAQIHVGCTIGHDTVVGAYTTMCPGVRASGNVKIGEGVFIGAGAVLINGSAGKPLVIGDNSIIAAGACVTRDVEPGAMVAGVPATRRR